jgi:hypothetical protein
MTRKFVALALLLLPMSALAQSPLDQFRGHFRGTATGTFTSGASEPFRCTATNGGSGQSLTINIRCANATGARFEVRSLLTMSGQVVSGTWRIVDPSYDGTISGSVSGSEIRVAISGAAFKGTASVTRIGSGLKASITIADGVKLVGNLGH